MQPFHAGHDACRAHVDVSPRELEFDESQIAQGSHAGQDVAPDLAVGPVADGLEANQVVILGLPEGVFHHVPVQTGPHDLVRAPVRPIRDDNVLAKTIDVATDPVVVLAKA